MKWKTKEIENAKTLLKSGFNYKEIGNKIKRTDRAVKNKLEEYGLKFSQFHQTRHEIKCLNCNNRFETIISDPKKFCSSSCAAIFNNTNRKTGIGSKIFKKLLIDKKIKNDLRKSKLLIQIKKGISNCLFCNIELKNNNKSNRQIKYCSYECNRKHKKKKIFEEIENGNTQLYFKNYKKYLIEKNGEKCMECGWCEKNTYSNKIPIELEHIDGNSENNDLKNLKLLCPNCHSLTSTYKGLNKGKSRHKRMERYNSGKSF